uniref:Uncharacterized protein n=1 Tax=Anguilla anguilla TaxID=7936 RepID=A0A0E9S7Q6_ANGAN
MVKSCLWLIPCWRQGKQTNSCDNLNLIKIPTANLRHTVCPT